MLYIFGGLPATGKTALSKFIASRFGAAYLRVDTIEQTLKNTGSKDVYDEGYQIAFSVALDNLQNGMPVVADSSNTIEESRQAWIDVAKAASSPYVQIEIICSDEIEHRRRVEHRISDIPALQLSTWKSVMSRQYDTWDSANVVIDTAGKTLAQSQQTLISLLRL